MAEQVIEAGAAAQCTVQRSYMLNRKQVLMNDRVYWRGRRTQDVILSAIALITLSPRYAADRHRQPRCKPDFFSGACGTRRQDFQILQSSVAGKMSIVHKAIGRFRSVFIQCDECFLVDRIPDGFLNRFKSGCIRAVYLQCSAPEFVYLIGRG